MAINPETEYPGQITAASAGYPLGSARNITAPGDGLGTPLEKLWVNDLLGFEQALLDDAGASPSGTPDQVGASQYLDAIKTIIAAAQLTTLQARYPIGEIFGPTVSADPATLLGFGTWIAEAEGRVIVGLDSGDTDFDAVGETGGSKTHTLIVAELPTHTHTIAANISIDQDIGGVNVGRNNSSPAGGSTGSTGGNVAHNNVQPYSVWRYWKRTA